MPFTGLDNDDITDTDLALFVLRRHHAGARGQLRGSKLATGLPAAFDAGRIGASR
jgi:hypothetical protein